MYLVYLQENMCLNCKKKELDLGFEPIKNAPNLHIEWKGDW
jgi:hypothetical protein